MATLYPPNVDNGKSTFCGLPRFARSVIHLGMSEEKPQYHSIGERLERLRTSFSDLSQKAWAEKHGFQNTQWNNWEKGTRRIPVDAAEKLCGLYGLTLDFIYLGRRDGLSDSASKSL